MKKTHRRYPLTAKKNHHRRYLPSYTRIETSRAGRRFIDGREVEQRRSGGIWRGSADEAVNRLHREYKKQKTRAECLTHGTKRSLAHFLHVNLRKIIITLYYAKSC